MTPQPGDYVTIILSCGMMQKGVVKVWAEDDSRGITWSILQSTENKNLELHIQNYWIAAFQLNMPVQTQIKKPKIIVSDDSLPEKINETNPRIRAQKIANIRINQAESEKQNIRAHLSRNDNEGINKVKYVLPSFKKYIAK